MDKKQDTKFGSLDMASKQDRRTLIRAVNGRWPIGDDLRSLAVEKLQSSLEHCDASEAREVASLLRVAAAFEGQNQEDEHLVEKYQRIDDEKGTESLVTYEVVIPESRQTKDGGD